MNHSRLLLTLAVLGAARLDAQGTALSQGDTTRLSLGDAARLAARQNALAQGAAYRAEAARGRALEVRSALLPQVSATYSDGQRTYNTASFGLPFPGFDPHGTIIGPVRTVDIRGHVLANLLDPAALQRYRAASAAASSAGAEATSVAQQAATTATALYLRALRAEAQLNARAEDSALAMELLDIAERQLASGVGVALDVTRAKAQVAGVRAQLIAARNERDRSRLDLARAIGLAAGSHVALSDTLSPSVVTSVPTEADALNVARQRRADLRAADAAVQTARMAVSAAHAERLPTLGVFGDDGRTSNSYTHLLNTYTYGFQVTLPIFEGMRTEAHVQQQSAALHEAEARRRDVEAQVTVDVEGALLDLNAGQEQVAAAQERLSLGEQELAQARERFRAGVAGNADVITAQLNLDTARAQYVDALASLGTARVALARAQGLLLELP